MLSEGGDVELPEARGRSPSRGRCARSSQSDAEALKEVRKEPGVNVTAASVFLRHHLAPQRSEGGEVDLYASFPLMTHLRQVPSSRWRASSTRPRSDDTGGRPTTGTRCRSHNLLLFSEQHPRQPAVADALGRLEIRALLRHGPGRVPHQRAIS